MSLQALFPALSIFVLAASPLLANAPSQKDIAYLSPERREKMDAWLPADSFPRPVPAVLLIHGGGWAVGDKASAREKNVASTLAAAGFAVFSINYHLERTEVGNDGKSRQVSAWPQNFYDCKSALRYLKKEAAQYGIDPKRIAVMGGSAGAHLAMMVGVTAQNKDLNAGGLYPEENNDVVCIVNFYGIADVRKFGRKNFSGATSAESEQIFDQASPIRYLDKNTPPMLVVHGDKDPTVPLSLSTDLVAELARIGISHEYIEVKDGPHSFDLVSTGTDLSPALIAFLEKHLGSPKSLATKSESGPQ